MKVYKTKVFNGIILAFFLVSGIGQAQQRKTYKETFDVSGDVELALNTTHADIEFETWNRKVVEVEAVITLVGASEEEAKAYFDAHGVEIMGNSSRVEVRTTRDRDWSYGLAGNRAFDFEVPDVEVPDLAPILERVEIPELAELPELDELSSIAKMPPMPPMPPTPRFDYEAYEAQGEAYLKEWREAFEENFDEDYREQLEAWALRAEEQSREREERLRKNEGEMEKRMEARAKQMEEARAELARAREQAEEARQQARQSLLESRKQAREQREKARAFFMQGEGRNRNFKIQKQIRIRMPKGVRLKLDVRHGEVKLAENAIDLKATLSYVNLFASNIAGEQTRVSARYSPVRVKQWDSGRLDTDFSEDVRLERVRRLSLRATSSDITIAHLLKNASIRNELGALHIGSIDRDFEDLTVSVLNGELDCALPESDFEILLTNQGSDIEVSPSLVWVGEPSAQTDTRRGFRGSREAGRSIAIYSTFSSVDLHD